MFYNKGTLEERLKSEYFVAILTPSDGIFTLLCIDIYVNNYTNLEVEGYNLSIKYVSKVGCKSE